MKTVTVLVRHNFYDPAETEKTTGRLITLPAMPDKVFFACKVASGYTGPHRRIWAIVDPISGIPLSCQQWISEGLRDVKERANGHLLNDLPKGVSYDEYIADFLKKKKITPIESNIKQLA